MKPTYLKLQNTTVMSYDIDEGYYKVYREDLLPFIIRGAFRDTTLISDNAKSIAKIQAENINALAEFYTNRTLSINRENAKFILNQLGLSQKSNLETKQKIMKLCKALSVADDYWITEDEHEKWEDVNLRDNPLHETLAHIALYGKSLTVTGKIRTPELTGQGAYAKAWFRENGKLFLYKASTKNGTEAQREALTSRVLDCFNVPHVHYELSEQEGRTVTKCENINNAYYGIADAGDVNTWCLRHDIDFMNVVKKTDAEMFYKTVVVDYLCANRDRHDANWGFYMNNMTGELICMHPLFDHNNAFDEEFMNDENGGLCQLIPGKTMKEAALYAIKHCDFRCIKPVTRSMFFDDTMYTVFMKRAEELGLYRQRKVPLIEKIFKPKCDTYVPVEIKSDNSDDYNQKLQSLVSAQNKGHL